MRFRYSYRTQDDAIAADKRAGFQIIRSKVAPVTFALSVSDNGKAHLKAWRGKAAKPSFYYSFSTLKRAEEYAAEYAEKIRATEERKQAEKAEIKAKRTSKTAADFHAVGDTFYTSWGYDQTNVEYYQIVKLNPRSVVVRQIAANNSDHGQPGGGKTAPRRYEYVGPEIFCPIDEDGGFNAGPCWSSPKPQFRHRCYKWDGRAKYTSSDH